MIKYVALWNLAEGVSEEVFDAVYRRHVEAAAARMPGLLKYRISKVIPMEDLDHTYYRMAELYFEDAAAFREGMNYLATLPADDPANTAAPRQYMSSACRFICDEETIRD